MLYLNDDFQGFPTTFYKGSQKHYTLPDPAKVLHELIPERGSCLVFNHNLTHDGGKLNSGTKYLLRTEVMYQRVCSDGQAFGDKCPLDEIVIDHEFASENEDIL